MPCLPYVSVVCLFCNIYHILHHIIIRWYALRKNCKINNKFIKFQ